MSFQDGATHLGMNVSGTDLADQFSSFAKYEEIEPAFRTMSGYGTDVIVIRSKVEGQVNRAAEFSRSPIINAGDGAGEHPTQALLDLYTIWKQFQRLDHLVIGLGGDLKYGRTVHSLIRVLSKFEGNSFVFVSPDELKLPDFYKQMLEGRDCTFSEVTDHHSVMGQADVWYWTRCQFERSELSKEESERMLGVARRFSITTNDLKEMRTDAILMHPQPIDLRIWEVAKDVVWQGMRPFAERDKLYEKIRIFEQSDNGLWSRMALLYWVIMGHFSHQLC